MGHSAEASFSKAEIDLWQFLAVGLCMAGLLLSAAVAPALGGVIDVGPAVEAGEESEQDDEDVRESAHQSEDLEEDGDTEEGSETGDDDPSETDESGTADDEGDGDGAGTGEGESNADGDNGSDSGTDAEDESEQGESPEGSPESGHESETDPQDQDSDESDDRETDESAEDGSEVGTETNGDQDRVSRTGQQSPSGIGLNDLSEERLVGGPIPEEAFQDAASEVVFVSSTQEPVYWRLGSYDTYTGQGWARERSYDDFSSQAAGGEGRLSQDVVLNEEMNVIPGAWEPVDVNVDEDRSLESAEDGSVRASESLEAGTSLTVVSDRPTADPDRLRNAGTAYDPGLHAQYTQLPGETPARVDDFTAELTAEDDTPYETAKTVETWIKQNKSYDLGASHDVDEPMVDQFIFEMDAVYCDYAASAMVVMLRTQDVPARYVTGYAPGTQVEDKQVVTQQNAHAWVEVYFPNEGWVRFDPTPPSDRQDAMQESLGDTGPLEEAVDDFESEVGEDVTDGEESSDTDDEPEESTDGEDAAESEEEEVGDEPEVSQPDIEESPGEDPLSQRLDPPYDVDLNRSHVPGEDVRVTVSKSGVPIPGASVSIEGESVGETDDDGAVVATAPFVQELTITVAPPEPDDRPTDPSEQLGTSPLDEAAVATFPLSAGVTDEHAGSETNETFSTDSELRLTTDGVATPEGTVDVVVQLDDRPVGDAAVSIDGQHITTTDANGTAAVELPDEIGNVTLRAERGEFVDEHSIAVEKLQTSVETRVPLPGRTVTVSAVHGDTPLENATVYADGGGSEITNEEGAAAVALPVASETVVHTEYGGTSDSVTVAGLYRYAGGLAAGFLLGVALVVRRTRLGVDTLERGVAATQRLTHWLYRFLIRLCRRPVDAAVFLGRLIERTSRRMLAFLRGLPGATWNWLRDVARTISRRGIAAVLLLDPRRLYRYVVSWFASLGSGDSEREGPSERGAAAVSSGDEATDTGITLRELWEEFLSLLRPPRVQTKTPGEIQRYAVAKGFPEEPVERIVQAFRDAEYGVQPPGAARIERVHVAVDALTSDEGSASAEDDDDTQRTREGSD